VKFNEQCTEKRKNQSFNHYSSQNTKEKQHCLDDLEKIYCKDFTNTKSNMRGEHVFDVKSIKKDEK